MSQVEMHKSSCRTEYVLFNHVEKINYTQNDLPHDFSVNSLDAIQIQPQGMKLILKKRMFVYLELNFYLF